MDSPLSINMLMMTLDNIYQNKMKEKLPDTFGASFQKMICYAENSLKSSEL